jgi:hypothetical protein
MGPTAGPLSTRAVSGACDSGCSYRASSWQRQGSSWQHGSWTIAQQGWSHVWQSAAGAACATTAAQAAKTHPKELLVRTTGRTPLAVSTGTAAGWFANRHPPTIVVSFPGDGWGDNSLAAVSQ